MAVSASAGGESVIDSVAQANGNPFRVEIIEREKGPDKGRLNLTVQSAMEPEDRNTEKLRSTLNQVIHEIVDKHFRGKDENASQADEKSSKTSDLDPQLVLRHQNDQKQAFLAAAQSRLGAHTTGGLSAAKYQIAAQQAVQQKKLQLANSEKPQDLSEEQA